MDETERQRLEALLRERRRVLHATEVQIAQYGRLFAPPELLVKAEDLRAEVQRLAKQLDLLQPGERLALQVAAIAAAFGDSAEFQRRAAQAASAFGPEVIPQLPRYFHDPPPRPAELGARYSGLGQWMSVCQHAIFAWLPHYGAAALPLLFKVARGRYDWTQARAVSALCAMARDGVEPEQIVAALAEALPSWRMETVHRTLPEIAQLAASAPPLLAALRTLLAALYAEPDDVNALEIVWHLAAAAPEAARAELPFLRRLMLTDTLLNGWPAEDELAYQAANPPDPQDEADEPEPVWIFAKDPSEQAIRAAFTLLHLAPADTVARAALTHWRDTNSDPNVRAEIAASLARMTEPPPQS